MIYDKIFQEQLKKVTPDIKKEMDWSAEIVKRIEQILKRKESPGENLPRE